MIAQIGFKFDLIERKNGFIYNTGGTYGNLFENAMSLRRILQFRVLSHFFTIETSPIMINNDSTMI